MCLLNTCISPLVKGQFISFAYFKIIALFFITVKFEGHLYILDTSPLSDVWFANIFSGSVVHLFIF